MPIAQLLGTSCQSTYSSASPSGGDDTPVRKLVMLRYFTYHSGHGTQSRVHFIGKRPTRSDPRLNTEMLPVAVQVLQSALGVTRQSTYISCASYEFSIRRACGASCPAITSCSVSACKAYTPNWAERRGALVGGGPLAPLNPAGCAWGRTGTG